MANVHDYLRWRGDISLVEQPFNDADNLILSLLSYLDFSGIVPSREQGGSIELGEACATLVARANGNVRPYVRSLAKIDTDFVRLLASSRRFGPSRLRAYADIVDERQFLQFGALTVDLPQAGCYVSFRGTDSTLVGWEENLMISFQTTAGQHEARSYLERVLTQGGTASEPVRVGGHSKGGNLAEYAAASCPDHLRQRILCVYSNDGPGMAPEVMAHSTRALLGDTFRHIVPAYSVIGMLFARKDEPRTIVASSAAGIEQHDPVTWQLTPTGFQEATALSPDCLVVNNAIASWVKAIPLDKRESVTASIFEALRAGGATRLNEIASSPEHLQKVLRALGATDEHTREVALALVQSAVDSSVESVREAARRTLQDTRRRLMRQNRA